MLRSVGKVFLVFFLSKSCFLVLSNYWTFFCCLLAISNLLTFGLFLSGFIQPKLNLIDLKIFLSFISRRFNFVQLILLNCTEISRITNEYYSIIMEKTESFTCLDEFPWIIKYIINCISAPTADWARTVL